MGDPPLLAGYIQMYWVSFLSGEVPRKFPIKECRGQAATRAALRLNFLHRHIRDTMVILEDDNLP